MSWFKRKKKKFDWYVVEPQADMTSEEIVLILRDWPDAFHFGVTAEPGYTPTQYFAERYGKPEIGRHFTFVPEKATA